MFPILLSYTLKPYMLEVLNLLFLIPVIMAIAAVIVIRKVRAATSKRFAYDDAMAEKRQKEIEAEKALDDDFGESWHIHGEN